MSVSVTDDACMMLTTTTDALNCFQWRTHSRVCDCPPNRTAVHQVAEATLFRCSCVQEPEMESAKWECGSKKEKRGEGDQKSTSYRDRTSIRLTHLLPQYVHISHTCLLESVCTCDSISARVDVPSSATPHPTNSTHRSTVTESGHIECA